MRADRSQRVGSAVARTLSSVLPDSMSSFGAFCGTEEQRRLVIQHAIGPTIGQMGVLVVHSDPLLEAGLCGTASAMGAPAALFGCMDRGHVPVIPYDPLCWLDEPAVLEALGAGNNARLAAKITDCLRVVDELAHMDTSHEYFDRCPYGMTVMKALASLGYEDLEDKVLSKLPSDRREVMTRRMCTDDDMWMVWDALNALSASLASLAPPSAAPALATSVPPRSAASVVASGGLACVGIPAGASAALNQLDIEVDCLLRRGIPFALVVADVNIAGSPLERRIVSRRTGGLMRVGVASALPSMIVESKDQVPSLLGALDCALVFTCPNVGVARLFTEAFGSYERVVREEHHGWSHEFFDLLPRLDSGVHERIVQEDNVRPEDMVGMRGALVCGASVSRPYTVRWLDLSR